VLRIAVRAPLRVAFGRFRNGRPVLVCPGEYLYVGSASPGGLAARVLRHATRTPGKSSHAIRRRLVRCLAAHGSQVPRRRLAPKHLRWHIDYLLDRRGVRLEHVYLFCSPLRLETGIARYLLHQECTSVVSAGLGATDAPGHTHLLRVRASNSWWAALPADLMHALHEMEPHHA